MPNFPESGIKLVAETKDYTSAMDYAIFQAEYFDSLGELTLEVTADVDTSALSEIEDMPLDGETISVSVDASVEASGDPLPFDGESIETTTDNTVKAAPADETTAAILDSVNFLKNLKIIETVWTITGNAVEILGKFADFAITPMLSLDDAIAKVNAQTGNAIPNARELISGIFYDDLGESIGQVGDLVIKAQQIQAPIDDAVRSALTFTHTFTDQNPEQVLDALNRMVKDGLAKNFKEAGDMLTVAFQNGGNRAGDLLNTISDNATAIKDLGLDGKTALGLITNGLDAGFKSAQDVVNSFLKIKTNATNAAGNTTSDVTKTFKQLGIANPAETGEAWSKDFIASVIKGIQTAPVSDSEKMAMFSNLIGGKMGAKEFSAFMKLSSEDAADIFANMQGAAEDAAKKADDSLKGAIDDFHLAVEKAVEDWLSSDAIDLPGKITALKTGLQNGLDVLAKGGTLGEALTIALKPIGFDDEFQGLEKSLGDFVIGILQVVAQLQDLTGHGKEAGGTRSTIEGLAQNQLAFNLKIANPDEIADEIKIATQRGLDSKQIASSIGTAVNELVKEGSPEAAQAIIDAAKTSVGSITFDVQGVLSRKLLESQGQNPTFSVPVTTEMTPEDVQKTIDDTKAQFQANGFFLDATVVPSIDQSIINDLQDQVNDAFAETNPTMEEMAHKTTDVKNAGDELNTTLDTTKQNADNANLPISNLAKGVDKMGGEAKKTSPAIDSTSSSLSVVTVMADDTSAAMYGMADSLQVVLDKAGAVSTAADDLAKKNGEKDNSGNGTSGSVGDTTPVMTSGQGLAGGGFLRALLPHIPILSGTGGGKSSIITVNNNNNIQSEAQADSVGFSTRKQLAGM